MIVRNFHLVLATQLVYIVICQNARSYDTNDWVPITQNPNEESVPKKATGRVLNLDAPVQKFFAEDEYLHKKLRPNSQQRLKQKERFNVSKYDNGYKFEETQQAQQNGIPVQYFANQEIKLPNYEQPPPLDTYRSPPRPSYIQNSQPALLNTREKAPSPNAPNLYEQYNVPLNASSLYQFLNPGSINQELVGALQFQQDRGTANIQNNQRNQQQVVKGLIPKKPERQKGEVQLVYVPLESLKPHQPITQDSQTIYRQIQPQRYDSSFPNQQVRLEAIENDFVQQALQAQRLQQQIQEGQPILLQTTTPVAITTKKRKAHQPPLAVYIEGLKQADVIDVLEVLKDAKSIAVQDSIQGNSPQIFIGPSSLRSPEGYTKFPLPYLNNLSGNRVERKIEQLPFFVAPLSFKTPPGFSKIPLPSPHVGSVVISNKEELHGKRSTPNQNKIFQYEEGQVTSPSVTKSAQVDNVTPQAYLAENFYNQGHFLAPKPELLHFTVANIGDYRIPASTYSPESFLDQYNSNFGIPPKVMADKYEHQRLSSKGQQASSTVRYTGEQDNEIRSTTRNAIDGQQFPADVQQIRVPSRTKSYLDTHNFDDSLSEIPLSSQHDFQIPSRSNDRENKIKNSSKFNHKSRHEPISTTLDTSYDSRAPDATPINITPKVTSPSPIPQVSLTYTDSERSTPQSPDINPLELAINEFELYQINSQLQEKPRVKNQYQPNTRNQHQDSRNYYQGQNNEEPDYQFDPQLHRFSSTPASILRDSYVETTVRPTAKTRRRGRPTKPTTTTPLPEKDKYTVLEEFTARQPATPEYSRESGHSRGTEKSRVSEYSRKPDYSRPPEYSREPQYSKSPEFTREPGVQYATEIEEIPARVHIVSTTTPAYGTVDEITENKSTTSPRYEAERTEIEDIPARVYSLNVNDNVQYTGGVPAQNQQLDQTLMDQQILQGAIDQERPRYETDSHSQQFYEQGEIQPLVHNRGQSFEYPNNNNENTDSNRVTGYDSSLEDPSVRSLLRPNLLVPTTTDEPSYSAPKYIPTTEEIPITTTTTTTTTTERYVETTPRGRGRGRQRGGSRYDLHTTRRTVSRRRPTHAQRTTTESSGYSGETGDVKKVNSRQRLRTRGRVTPNSIAERLSTTENEIYNSPTSEAAIQILTNPSEPKYRQYGHSADTKLNGDFNENNSKEPTSRRPVLQYENTAITPSPIVDYRISHQPANRHENNLNENFQQQQSIKTQSDVVYEREDSPREIVRVRGRIRGRPQPTVITSTEATTTRRTTTPRPAATEEEEEFYGFFRQPNFGSPPAYLAEDMTTTDRPRVQPDAYHSESSFPSEQPHEDHRLEFDNTNFESTTPRFLGEIVPKYQTTSREVQVEPETEAPRPRIRGRLKVPQRNSQKGSYEDPRPQEQATRRSNVIRSRGRAHFRLPDGVKKEKDEDEVAGGNYPSSFFQNKQQYTTRAPSFQITVDPLGEDDADQAPHPSIYIPSVVVPEEWHDASEYDAGDKGQTSGNTLESADYQQNDNTPVTTTTQPLALPVKASTEVTASSEETYRATTKAMEDLFETINNNFENVDETSKKQPKRRKGVWKLVKHRPVDNLAAAESQNYFSVLNSYLDIQRDAPKEGINNQFKPISSFQSHQKLDPQLEELQDEGIADYTTAEPEKEESPSDAPITDENIRGGTKSATEADVETVGTTDTPIETSSVYATTLPGSFFDTIYEMFGMSNKDQPLKHISSPALEEETPSSTTTNVPPTFPQEITEVPTSTNTHNVTETPVDTTTDQEIPTTTGLAVETSNFEVAPWEMRAVRTSTSTEVSHETEICYKGKCIKSRDRKKRL